MDETYSGIHVHGTDDTAIVGILTRSLEAGGYARLGPSDVPTGAPTNQFLISTSDGPWITVLPSNDLEGQEFTWAEMISRAGGSALWLYLYEGSLLMYRLYRSGQLLDRYHWSAAGERLALGSPRTLKPLLAPGVTVEDVDRTLHPGPDDELTAIDRYRTLARQLGIDRAVTSFANETGRGLASSIVSGQWDLIEFAFVR